MKELTMRYTQGIIIAALLTLVSQSGLAQCGSGSFNCNDTIQVSVDEMCMATISADMILEQPNASCTYDLQFFDENESEINVPGNVLGVSHVGRTIQVKVREANVASPNSCWGYIRVEDKIPAIIECPDFPIFQCIDSDNNDPGRSDEELAARIRREILAQSNINDNCTDTASFEVSILRNQLQQLQCSDDYGAQRIIEFDLIGVAGTVVLNCLDTIFFSKFDTDDIDDPRDFTDTDPLECDGTYRNRTWEVPGSDSAILAKYDLDVYPNFIELYNLDRSSFPNIGGRPVIEWDEEQEAFVRVGFCNINASFTDLPPFEICGRSYKLIRSWTIIDWCKTSEPKVVNQIIEVRDIAAPVFSLDAIDDVEAGANTCTGVVDLPEPEVTDECNEWTYCISYKLPGEALYRIEDEYQELEEGDTPNPLTLPIGTTRIKYTVKDLCGNQDSMFRNVTVEDVNGPLAVCDTRTILSLNNNSKGKIFPPTIDDNSFDNCTDQLIFRIWREDENTALNAPDSSFVKFDGNDAGKDVRVAMEVEDSGGMTSRCWTTVEVQGTPAVTACPSTVGTLDFCDHFSTYVPEQQGLEAVVLERTETGCGEGYLLVQWIDTSAVEANSVLCVSDTMYFERLNSIQTSDFAIPQDVSMSECDFTSATSQDLADVLNNTSACNFLDVIAQDIIFSEKIFRNFSVIDLCTNITLMQHTQIIELIAEPLNDSNIDDLFQVHIPGVTVEMEEDGEVTIPADFFNVAPADACFNDLDVRVRRRGEGVFSESITFRCDDIGVVVVFDLEVALYDDDGNQVSTKNTKILIDDKTAKACPAGSIAGLIMTENGDAVENVAVKLVSITNDELKNVNTSVSGQYVFDEILPDQYKIVSDKNDDVINGVSTLDLLLMQQHIIGIKTLDSPYKIIASDINNDQRVSALDLVELRRVILGITNEFNFNDSWRFVNADQTFDDLLNPWDFNEKHDTGGNGDFDFVGVKIGDVNANVIANSLMTQSRNNNKSNITIEEKEINKGESTLLNVKLDNESYALGFQLKIVIDSEVEILNILDESGHPLSNDEWTFEDGELTISHISSNLSNQRLFSMEIKSLTKSVTTSEIINLSEDFKNEWYTSDYSSVNIENVDYSIANDGMSVEVTPNPFDESTTLRLWSRNDGDAQVTITDLTGKRLITKTVLIEQGFNSIAVDGSDLYQSGIYIYEVKLANESKRGKMIYVD